MNLRRLFLTLAAACVAAGSMPAQAQVPLLLNGNLETPDPDTVLAPFKAEGFRTYNYCNWVINAPVTRSGTHAAMIPGGQGRPNGEFEGVETEDPIDDSAFTPTYNWPEFTFNPPAGKPLNVGFWYNIPADDAVVVSRVGLKFAILRNSPGNFGAFQEWQWDEINPKTMMSAPGVVVTTRTGPFGPNGETVTLPAYHTNGAWLRCLHTVSQATDVCTDFGGSCMDPPTNPAYCKILAQRFDEPDVFPCGPPLPPCTRGRSYGTVWVDDFFFKEGPLCLADFNGNGQVTIQDIFDFLTAYFLHQATADFNANGQVSIQDLFDFLTAYFAGCH